MPEKTEDKKEDYDFLKGDPWEGYGFTHDQVIEMYKKQEKDILDDDPEIEPDELREEALDDLEGYVQGLLKGGYWPSKGVILGFEERNNYLERWRNAQLKAYDVLLNGKADSVKVRMTNKDGKVIKKTFKSKEAMIKERIIKIVKSGNKKTAVALDTRNHIEKKRGLPYGVSSNMAGFHSIWLNPFTGKKTTFLAMVGGEPWSHDGDARDFEINPVCPKCGEVSLKKVCNKILVKGNEKTPCGHVKEGYILQDVMENVGKLMPLTFKMEINNGKVEDVKWPIDDDYRMTNFKNGIKLSVKAERVDGETIYTGSLMDWINPDFILNSKQVNNVWKDDHTLLSEKGQKFWNKHGDKPVFYIGKVYSFESQYGNRIIWLRDKTTDMANDEGMKVVCPPHVNEFNVKNKVGKKSIILVAGELSRSWERDPKGKGDEKFKTKKVIIKKGSKKVEETVHLYNKPHIDATCVIVIKQKIKEEEMEEEKIQEINIGNDYIDVEESGTDLDNIPIENWTEDELEEAEKEFQEKKDKEAKTSDDNADDDATVVDSINDVVKSVIPDDEGDEDTDNDDEWGGSD
jgi:hypothetical protein